MDAFTALADPTRRRRIVEMLAQGALSAVEIVGGSQSWRRRSRSISGCCARPGWCERLLAAFMAE